jgi:hypothetical protein
LCMPIWYKFYLPIFVRRAILRKLYSLTSASGKWLLYFIDMDKIRPRKS